MPKQHAACSKQTDTITLPVPTYLTLHYFTTIIYSRPWYITELTNSQRLIHGKAVCRGRHHRL